MISNEECKILYRNVNVLYLENKEAMAPIDYKAFQNFILQLASYGVSSYYSIKHLPVAIALQKIIENFRLIMLSKGESI
jgi:hypothetical protein